MEADKQKILADIVESCRKYNLSVMINMELDISNKDIDLSIKPFSKDYRMEDSVVIGKGHKGGIGTWMIK